MPAAAIMEPPTAAREQPITIPKGKLEGGDEEDTETNNHKLNA